VATARWHVEATAGWYVEATARWYVEATARWYVEATARWYVEAIARWYVEQRLPVVISSITERAPRTRLRGWRLHHDNVPAHTVAVNRQFMDQNGIRRLSHPPY
jgi:hypothetical protein